MSCSLMSIFLVTPILAGISVSEGDVVTRAAQVLSDEMQGLAMELQGYLAHKKTPPPP